MCVTEPDVEAVVRGASELSVGGPVRAARKLGLAVLGLALMMVVVVVFVKAAVLLS